MPMSPTPFVKPRAARGRFRGGDTVLVVDDNPLVLGMIRCLLQNSGIRAQVVRDVSQALAVLDELRVAAVLLDLHMPSHDGLRFLPKIRAFYPHVPVIIYTGASHGPDTAELCRKLGATDFVVKSDDTKVLLATVQRAIHSHRQARAEAGVS